MKKLLLLLSTITFFVAQIFATHNRAGEITFTHISGNTYKIKIVTYTKASSAADRAELPIFWGDGTGDTLQRINGPLNNGIPFGEILPNSNDMKKNIYEGTHTYPGPGNYIIYFEDPNRNAGVINIPNSVSVPFYIETLLVINPFLGSNNSPVLNYPPIDEACVGRLFLHNPNAFDPDGDSLAYKLVSNKGAGGAVIPGYSLPVASSSLSLDPLTGDFIWDAPTLAGEFNIAMHIEEWRDGVLIGYVTRDMQINVHANCLNNFPPVIAAINDFCVEAGTNISFNVTATDPNPTDIVTLTGTGAPFNTSTSPAFFNQGVSGMGTVTGSFTWNTHCSHVRKPPYQVLFKAQDNGQVILVDLERTNITVVGPSPKNPVANPFGTTIQLSWDASVCTGIIGYDIYRRNGYIGFIPSQCETGVPSYTGYTKIGSVLGLNNTFFTDNNNGAGLSPGIEYCYMIVAVFPDGAESYASLEVCAQLKKDIPVITNVSVQNTDASNGEIYVAWSKPTEFDTIAFPGPYSYILHRSEGFSGNNFVQVTTFNNINDTIFTDSGINTLDNPWSYKIEFYSDNIFIGQTQIASSVFLSVSPTDNRNILSWEYYVPWINNFDTTSQYEIFRKDPAGTVFNSIGFSNTRTYTDTGLVNGEEYCYYVKTTGHYTASGFVDPIINLSQEKCGIPVDNEPPCSPIVNVISDCNNQQNTLVWKNPVNAPCPDDIMHFNIYFKQFIDGDLILIATISSADDTVRFLHAGNLVGCYAVTAVDSLLNESPIGQPICVDSDFQCDPQYNLPNVFSPNGDGFNDFFHPCDNTTDPIVQLTCKPYRLVQDVHITFYNRWGQLVFETTDIDINWNGKNQSGQELTTGTYFYVAKVNFIKLSGVEQKVMQGFVQLIR